MFAVSLAPSPSAHTSEIWLRHLVQPSLRIAAVAGLGGQRANQLRHRFEIMDRPQLVDMRQQGADAFRLGLETGETQQRIEPDQPPAGAMEAVDLEGEPVGGIVLA